MPPPEFSKKTIENLAKRARFQCSNPDCRAHTVGPNSDLSKSTNLGEAAHIYGAKKSSARFDPTMSDGTRSSITNGIWLCRNCHGLVDRDAEKFPAELLMEWRKEHEELVLKELGTRGDILRQDFEMEHIAFLMKYPRIIQRIAIDKPEGWEWRLTSELLKHLNSKELRRLSDLQTGLYFKRFPKVGHDDFWGWFSERAYIMSGLVGPLSRTFDGLTKSWGEPGEPGDIEEIHHFCVLIRDLLAQMVDHEEELKFTQLPDEAEEIRDILLNAIGQNLSEMKNLPRSLDELVSLVGTDHGGTKDQPRTITYQVTFDLPENFNERIEVAIANYLSTLETL